MRKKKEPTFQITPKGLISCATASNNDIWDDIELYCYRHGFNAILINKDGGQFIHVEMEEK